MKYRYEASPPFVIAIIVFRPPQERTAAVRQYTAAQRGPRKIGDFVGKRRNSEADELSCLHGSDRVHACSDEVVSKCALWERKRQQSGVL